MSKWWNKLHILFILKVHHNSFFQIDPQLPANRCFYQTKLLCFSVQPLWFTTISAQKLLVDIIWYVKSVGGLEHFLYFFILEIIIPTDYHIFQRFRGVGIPPTRSSLLVKLAFLENSDVPTGDDRSTPEKVIYGHPTFFTRDLHEISGRSGIYGGLIHRSLDLPWSRNDGALRPVLRRWKGSRPKMAWDFTCLCRVVEARL
jgi:hypothetical protein